MSSANATGLAFAIAIIASCSPPSRTPEFCVVIAANDAEGAALIGLTDQFAVREGLVVTGEGVGGKTYQSRQHTIELGVTTYLGPIGAVLDVYTAQGSLDLGFRERLRRFLDTDVEPRWSVRDCADVPNLSLPRRIG